MKRTCIFAALLLMQLFWPVAGRGAVQQSSALSAEQIRDLLARVLENQHHNDDALLLYERREHRMTRKKEDDPAPDEDKVFRVVPTGTGTVKLVLEEGGKPVTAENYREQLRYLEQALVWALDPNESKQKSRVQKWERRARERFETVEAARHAFTCAPAGREDRQGVNLIKLTCQPNPAFEPATRTQELFQHARAVLWVEPRSAQLARVEAELVSDLSIGGGLLGKAYRGGKFVMEQSEIAPGIWLPSRIQYHLRGRKFVFGFTMNEETIASHYKRIGPPAEAVVAIRSEITGKATPSAPGTR